MAQSQRDIIIQSGEEIDQVLDATPQARVWAEQRGFPRLQGLSKGRRAFLIEEFLQHHPDFFEGFSGVFQAPPALRAAYGLDVPESPAPVPQASSQAPAVDLLGILNDGYEDFLRRHPVVAADFNAFRKRGQRAVDVLIEHPELMADLQGEMEYGAGTDDRTDSELQARVREVEAENARLQQASIQAAEWTLNRAGTAVNWLELEHTTPKAEYDRIGGREAILKVMQEKGWQDPRDAYALLNATHAQAVGELRGKVQTEEALAKTRGHGVNTVSKSYTRRSEQLRQQEEAGTPTRPEGRIVSPTKPSSMRPSHEVAKVVEARAAAQGIPIERSTSSPTLVNDLYRDYRQDRPTDPEPTPGRQTDSSQALPPMTGG